MAIKRSYIYTEVDDRLDVEVYDNDTEQNIGDFSIIRGDNDKGKIKDLAGGDVKNDDIKQAIDYWEGNVKDKDI